MKPTPAGTKTPNAVTFVTVTFENRAAQNVHVFVDGRETFGPENRLVPGAKRTLRVALPADGRLRFSAGRNGQVLARGTWNGDPADATRVPVVRFTEDGSPTLLVTTNLQ